MESMNNYVGMANQNPVSGNGQQIVTEFKSALAIIKRLLYQVENIISYYETNTNGVINNIKEYVEKFGRIPKILYVDRNNTIQVDGNEHKLPLGSKIVRKGRCYPYGCSWSNK
jgi:hypothetical protein